MVEEAATKIFGVDRCGLTMCDPFGGIGMVATAFKRAGWRVTVADHLLFPHYYQRARLSVSVVPRFIRLSEHLGIQCVDSLEAYIRNLPECKGWIFEEYGLRRSFFTPSNAAKINSVWEQIIEWKIKALVDDTEYAFLLSSLIDSFDRVANTAGTYYAYLKSPTRRACHDFCFRFLIPVCGRYDASCKQLDAITSVSNGTFDLLYLDPPYSSRSYDRYYHLPQTLVAGERVNVRGASGVPLRPPIKSPFESPRTAEQALSDLVDAARCSVLMVQYACGGLISLERIRSMLSARGRLTEVNIKTIGYTTKKQPRSAQHSLFVVEND